MSNRMRVEPKALDDALVYLQELSGESYENILKLFFEMYRDPVVQNNPELNYNKKRFKFVLHGMKIILTQNIESEVLRTIMGKSKLPYLFRNFGFIYAKKNN